MARIIGGGGITKYFFFFPPPLKNFIEHMYRKWQIFANQKYTANNKTGWANITIWEFKHKKSKFILYKSIKCKCAEKNNHSKSKLFKLITFFSHGRSHWCWCSKPLLQNMQPFTSTLNLSVIQSLSYIYFKILRCTFLSVLLLTFYLYFFPILVLNFEEYGAF